MPQHQLLLLIPSLMMASVTLAQNVQTNNQGIIVNVFTPAPAPAQLLNLPAVPVYTQADGDRDVQMRMNRTLQQADWDRPGDPLPATTEAACLMHTQVACGLHVKGISSAERTAWLQPGTVYKRLTCVDGNGWQLVYVPALKKSGHLRVADAQPTYHTK